MTSRLRSGCDRCCKWVGDVLHPTTARTIQTNVVQVVPIGQGAYLEEEKGKHASSPSPSPSSGNKLNVVEDIVREVSAQLRLETITRKALTGSALIAVLCIGTLMALMMWIATLENDVKKGGISSKAPAPYWLLIILLWLCMLVSSILIGFALSFDHFRNSVRGSLEYTTLMIYNLRNGTRYGYREHVKTQDDDDSLEARLCREKHQLKIEAGLAGWSEEAIEDQISLLEQAYEVKETLKEAKVESKDSKELSKDSPRLITSEGLMEHLEVVKVEAVKLFSMVKYTTKANHWIIGIVMCFFAFSTIAIGAFGSILTVKIAEMPNDDNPVWIERCWQLINAIFVIVAIWKGPQRALLFYYWIRRAWVHDITEEDGTVVPRSLLTPGVLLTHRQMGCIACLRFANIFFQYVVCFFMWAWLPRCLQEEKEQKVDCTSRPPWAVPVFLVCCIATDVSANVLLSTFIASCPYRKWPIQALDGPILVHKALTPWTRWA